MQFIIILNRKNTKSKTIPSHIKIHTHQKNKNKNKNKKKEEGTHKLTRDPIDLPLNRTFGPVKKYRFEFYRVEVQARPEIDLFSALNTNIASTFP